MKDESCICFLQWALPRLHMRWPGFKKVRGQVCKRLGRRLEELQLADLKNYRMYLEDNPLEWHILDSLCRITISRFYRDKGIFDSLYSHVLPELIEKAVRILFQELGSVETLRFLNIPGKKRIESVKRHRAWQEVLNKNQFFDEVFGENN